MLVAAPAGWQFIVSTPFRMRRMLAFLDPWAFRRDVGYQITESLISVGSGGVTGLGLGDGRQKLFFLPEAHTDFILSIVGEELGLLGVLFVIGAVRRRWSGAGCRTAFRARDVFGAYLAFGITTMFGLQALVNIGVVLGSLPTKGLPLPFISYGGTSLIMSLFAAGVLANISARNPEPGDWLLPGVRRRGSRATNRRLDDGPRVIVEVDDRPPPPPTGRRRRPSTRCRWLTAAPAAVAGGRRRDRRTSLSGHRVAEEVGRVDGRRGGVRRHGARPGDQAGPGGRLPAGAVTVSGLKRMGLRRHAAGAGAAAGGVPRVARASCAATAPTSCWAWAATRRGRWCSRRRCSGYPTAIQEQNSRPGLHQPHAGAVRASACSSRSTRRRARSPRRKVRFLGNPVRRSFLERAGGGRRAGDATTGGAIVILGGSQGSRAVNELALGMVRVLDARGRLPPVVHQTGADRVRRRCRSTTRRWATTGASTCARSSTTCPPCSRQAAVVRRARGRADAGRAGDHAAARRS